MSSVTLREQLLFLKQQAIRDLRDAADTNDISQRNRAIIQAAQDQVLTPLEIQQALKLSRSRYYQITRPDTRV